MRLTPPELEGAMATAEGFDPAGATTRCVPGWLGEFVVSEGFGSNWGCFPLLGVMGIVCEETTGWSFVLLELVGCSPCMETTEVGCK